LIRISPISHTRLAAFHSEKISAEPQKEAAQKDERSAPILIKTKHRVVDTFAELLKNWGTALMCEVYFKYIGKSIKNIFSCRYLFYRIDLYKYYFCHICRFIADLA